MFQKTTMLRNINTPSKNARFLDTTTYLNHDFQRNAPFLYKKMKKPEKNRKKTPKKRCKKTTAQKSDAFFVTYLNIQPKSTQRKIKTYNTFSNVK